MPAPSPAPDSLATLRAAPIPASADHAYEPLLELLPSGATWSTLLRRGTLLEFLDLEGAGTAAFTLLRADLTAERLNLPDSMKAQKISRVLEGTTLMSDMGRALATVVEDTAGGHDPIGGLTDEPRLTTMLGESSFQADRNHRWVSARTMLLVELEKYGLGKADLSDVVQLFSVLDVAADGALSLRHAGSPGARLVLRCELDLLALVHVGPHPYDDAAAWPGAPIGVRLHRARPAAAGEPARTARPQTARSIERADRAAAWAPQLAPGLAAGEELPGAAPASRDLLWSGPAPLQELPEAVPGEAFPGGRTLAGDPIVLPPAITPPPIDGALRLDEVIDSGDGWLRRVEAGEVLRIVDLQGNQAADTVFFCAERPADVRYSWTATIAAQRNPYLTTGSVLCASEGEPFATITADTVGRHDTVGGACARESNVVRYGEHTRYQHACRDTFVRELVQSGLPIGKRELAPNINFFMHVPLGSDGGLDFADGLSGPGQYFELTFHRPTWVLISNCPQINNPCNAFDPTPIAAQVYRPAASDAA